MRILAWLIFATFNVSGHGQSSWMKTRGYAIQDAKYQSTTDMLIECRQKGGDYLALVGHSDPTCQEWDGLFMCSVFSSAYCEKTDP